MNHTRSTSLLKKAIFSFLTILILLIAIEWVARTISGRHEKSPLAPHPQLLWALHQGSWYAFDSEIQINSLGMRGPELIDPKPKNLIRILFLGDSSIFGHGLSQEESFPELTVELLSKNLKRPVEMANAAVPGYSSYQCKIYYEQYASKIKPDVIVLAPLWSDMMRLPWTDRELLEKFARHRFGFAGGIAEKCAFLALLGKGAESIRGTAEKRKLAINTILKYDNKKYIDSNRRVSVKEHYDNLRFICEDGLKKGRSVVLLLLDCAMDYEKEQDIFQYMNNYNRLSAELNLPLLDLPQLLKGKSEEEMNDLFFDMLHPGHDGHILIAQKLTPLIQKTIAGF